jgi:hypothetical protein
VNFEANINSFSCNAIFKLIYHLTWRFGGPRRGREMGLEPLRIIRLWNIMLPVARHFHNLCQSLAREKPGMLRKQVVSFLAQGSTLTMT